MQAWGANAQRAAAEAAAPIMMAAAAAADLDTMAVPAANQRAVVPVLGGSAIPRVASAVAEHL